MGTTKKIYGSTNPVAQFKEFSLNIQKIDLAGTMSVLGKTFIRKSDQKTKKNKIRKSMSKCRFRKKTLARNGSLVQTKN